MKVHVFNGASFVSDFDTQFPDPFDADFFMVFLVAIDGQKEVSNQPSENLDHEPVPTAGDQVVHFQVAFPPAKKDFDGPTEFINRGDLLRREIKPA